MGDKRVNLDLQTLVQLQELDLAIKQCNDRLKKIPDELATLDRELTEYGTRFDQVKQRTEEGGRERRRHESEVEVLRQKLRKFKDQLMAVKTNKEYQAVLSEIATCEKEIAAKEDQILESMIQADELASREATARSELAEKEQYIQAHRKELEGFTADFTDQVLKLETQRRALRELVAPELLGQYERIATARHGVAVAPAQDQSCQACHVRLRPQLFTEIKTNQQIIFCESCNRILYYPDRQQTAVQ
jgi:uncharacterized protein